MDRARRVELVVDVLLILAIFLGSQRLYRWSPGLTQMADGCYSLAVTETLLRDGIVRLNHGIPENLEARRTMPGFDPQTGLPYHLVATPSGGIYYGYPLGSSLLSTPMVVYCTQVRGLSCFGSDGTYSLAGETAIHIRTAAIVTAFAVVVFYLIARPFLPALASAVLAVGFATGSMAWSTLTRSLWSHTWAVLLTALAVWVLVRLARRTERTWRSDSVMGLSLGILMFGMYFVRPQTALSALGILAFLALWHRRTLMFALIGGALCSGGLVAWSMTTFGSPLPPSVYGAGALDGRETLFRFTGLLVSPSRGLLLFCPYLVMFAYLLIAYRKQLSNPRLLLPAGLAIGAYLAMFTAYLGWHGGYSYGPRYFSDLLPWFVLVGAIACGGLRRGEVAWRKSLELALLIVCFAWAGFVHGRGAISWAAWEWNYSAHTDAEHVRLITDWQHPQFLAGITFDVRPDGTIVPKSRSAPSQ